MFQVLEFLVWNISSTISELHARLFEAAISVIILVFVADRRVVVAQGFTVSEPCRERIWSSGSPKMYLLTVLGRLCSPSKARCGVAEAAGNVAAANGSEDRVGGGGWGNGGGCPKEGAGTTEF